MTYARGRASVRVETRRAEAREVQFQGKERNCEKDESFLTERNNRGERSECGSTSERRAYGGCLGADRRRRTQQAAKSLGELQAS